MTKRRLAAQTAKRAFAWPQRSRFGRFVAMDAALFLAVALAAVSAWGTRTAQSQHRRAFTGRLLTPPPELPPAPTVQRWSLRHPPLAFAAQAAAAVLGAPPRIPAARAV